MQRQVIEHAGIPVGIAIPNDNRVRFIAVKFHVIELDNYEFASVGDLRSAIRLHLNQAPRAAA